MVGDVLSLFCCHGISHDYTEKTCCVKQHGIIDTIWEPANLICGICAVGGNYNLTHDSRSISEVCDLDVVVIIEGRFEI